MKVVNVVKVLKGFVLGLVVLGVCLGARSVRGKDTAYRARLETFFGNVMEIKVETAYDTLFDNSQINQKREIVDRLKKQTSGLLATLGTPLGYEFVKEQRYGDSIVRVVYILKYDKGPVIWDFYFYKPKSDWILITMEPGDRLAMLSDR
jgi:hypothetical protein